MIRPMMVMTTSISTSVKPASPLRSAAAALRPCRAYLMCIVLSLERSPDELAYRNQRRHYRDDQATNHQADGDNSSRTGNANQPVQRALQLGLVEFRYPGGQNRQLPGFVAESQHSYRHWRQCVGFPERFGQFRPMAHPVDHLFPDIGRAGRRHDIDEYPQRRRQMHATT